MTFTISCCCIIAATRMRELVQKARASGLEVLTKSHLGFFLYPGFWAVKKRGQRHLRAPEEAQKALVSRNITTASSSPLMNKLMRLESAARNWVYYPVGIRCLVTCRKPEASNP